MKPDDPLPAILELAEAVVRLCRVDVAAAWRSAGEMTRLAAAGSLRSRAWALRACGNVRHIEDRNQDAVEYYQQALLLFREAGDKLETARTLSSMVMPLALLGQYGRSLHCASDAELAYRELGEVARMARLEINRGNVYHRLDRFPEALECYERARAGIDGEADPEAYAVILSNQATTLITVNRFQDALEIYAQARQFCESHDMPLLVAQADYNIAWLHFLRGEYALAVELLNRARGKFRQLDGAYHLGLCDLDESEICLELNLPAEAVKLAQRGAERFTALGMNYELAKCRVSEARAAHAGGDARAALELFHQAAGLFAREFNESWVRIVDLYSCLVHLREGDAESALRLALAARDFFAQQGITTKGIFAALLAARAHFAAGRFDEAEGQAGAALRDLQRLEAPWLNFHAHLLRGKIALVRGQNGPARDSYRAALRGLDTMHGNIRFDEIKIAFLGDKLEAFETFVLLCLDAAGDEEDPSPYIEAFQAIEQAKSRSQANLISRPVGLPAAGDVLAGGLAARIEALHEELNGCYRRILHQEFRKDAPQSSAAFLQSVHAKEADLLDCLRQLPPEESYSAAEKPCVSLSELQECLPADTQVLEFFLAEQTVVAALVDRQSLRFFPGISLVSRVQRFLRLFRMQVSKLSLGEAMAPFAAQMEGAALAHLQGLYRELVAPVAAHLKARRLIVIPHGLLHGVPFHALHDGGEYLCDRHAISYAPSATLLRDSLLRRLSPGSHSLLLDPDDPELPHASREVQELSHLLPEVQVFRGSRAGIAALRGAGATARYVHIAGHGLFRGDHPLFSSIQLGDDSLTLLDVYGLRLNCELATLSGCATGRSSVLAGDNLVGLTRGFFYAGAAALLVSLWDVEDSSAARFMSAFYTGIGAGQGQAESLAHAMTTVRKATPHPYYWAPFFLVGKP